MTFDQAFDKLIGHEGGYSFHPDDPGGETMWGVTANVARANGYAGPMKQLPRDTAKEIYRDRYWSPVRAEELPDAIRLDVFDGAVNSGVSQSIKWLQQAAGVAVDGAIGPLTIQASKTPGIQSKYNGARLLFMTNLSTWPTFGKGWARRIADNLMGA